MLSRPPARLASAISASPASRSRGCGAQDLGQARLRNHRGQAVAAQQIHVAGAGPEQARIDLHRLLRPQRARDNRTLRVLFRFLGRQPSLADQLVHKRVVVGKAQQLAVAQTVRATVARHVRSRPPPRPRTPRSASSPCRPARRCSARAHGCARWPRPHAPQAAPPASPGRRGRRGRTPPRSATRPRRPAPRPCRRRPRTAVSAPAASPR